MPIPVLQRIANMFDGFAHETNTVTDIVRALDPTKYNPLKGKPAIQALFTIEDASIRYFYHGEEPTSTNGHLLSVGSSILIQGLRAITKFRFVRATTTNALYKITYER